MPDIVSITKDDWIDYGMDDESALIYQPTPEGGDYLLNMDNKYLLTELKGLRDRNATDLTKARYTYSMALIGMSIISHYRNTSDGTEELDVSAEVKKVTSMIAPVLIPMLDAMASLNLEDIAA